MCRGFVRSFVFVAGLGLAMGLGQVVVDGKTSAAVSDEDAHAIQSGIEAFQEENWKKAVKQLKPFLAHDNPLPDYMLYMVAKSYLELKECEAATPLLAQVRTRYPQSVFAGESMLLQAKALACDKKPQEARERAQQFLKTKPDERMAEEARLLIARTYLDQGERETAVVQLTDFWVEAGSDDLADSARQQLKKAKASPDRTAIFRRARHLYQQREWAPAKDLLVELGEQDSYMFAECIYRLRDYPRAKQLFQSLLDRNESPAQALGRLATIEARLGDYQSAIAHNRRLAEKYRSTKQQKSALKNIAFLHKDSFEFDKAAKVLRQLLNKRLGRRERAHTMSELAWVTYRSGDYDAAVTLLDELVKKEGANKDLPKFLFWKGQVHKKIAARTEDKKVARAAEHAAHEAFEEAWEVDQWGYYGLASLRELHTDDEQYRMALKSEDQKRLGKIRQVAVESNPSTAGLFHLPRAEALHTLGQKRLAADEMRAAYREAKGNKALVKKVGTISYAVGNYYVPMVVALNDPGLLDRPEDTWHWIYPEAYQAIVDRHARRHRIDPRLMYSMMKQESAFKEEAVSPVGARGLIQIMPFTGKRLATAMGWQGFNPADLFEPEINIALSALYMRMNADLFEDRLPMIIAAYNAGEAAVERWLPSRVDLEDWEFIEEIPYKETNKYTKLVIRNYWMYQYLYPDSEFDKLHQVKKRKT